MRYVCLFFFALLGLTSSQLAAQGDVSDRLGQIVDAAHTRGDFDGVVVVSQRGHVVYEKALGEADRTAHQPLAPWSVFRLASLTKQVTAVLILQQAERGTLRLDQPASELLPGLSATTGRVTVQQLLQHISGLPNPTSGPEDVVPAFYKQQNVGPNYLQETAKGFCSGVPVRPPDEKFEYNNCDYIVLGAILEHVSGLRFGALLQQKVVKPLGLTSWGIFTGSGNTPRTTKGYGAEGSLELPQNAATYGSAGALYGNAEDVDRWNRALLGHRLLSPSSTALLFKGERNLGGEALGCWSYDLPATSPAVHLVERQGDIGGTRVLSLLLPDQDASIVILANTEKADLFNTYSRKGLGYDLVTAFTGR